MNRLVAVSTAFMIAVFAPLTPFTPAPTSAAASFGVDDLTAYTMDFENASGPGDATEYLSHNGITYFTGFSLQYGRAVWAMDETTFAVTKVADNWSGTVTGNPSKLFAHGDYLFFVDMNSSVFTGYTPYVLQISTGIVEALEDPEDPTSGPLITYSASSFTESDGVVYFVSQTSGDSSDKLFSFDTANGALTNLGVTGFDLVSSSGLYAANNVRNEQQSLFAHAGFLYAAFDVSYPGADGLAIYDIALDTWNVDIADDEWVRLVGEYSLGGQEMALVLVAGTVGNYGGSNYNLVRVDSAGLMTPLLSTALPNYSNFKPFQFGDRLLAIEYYSGSNRLVEFTPGEGIYALADLTGALAGDGGSFNVSSAQVSGSQIFITGWLNDAAEQIYVWSGAPGGLSAPLPIDPLMDYNSARISNYPNSRPFNAQSGFSPTGMITSLYLSPEVGFEPYHVAFDGTLTLIRDLNLGSEGSSPDLDCAVEQNGSLYARTTAISREPGMALQDDALAIVTPTATNLEYEILIPEVTIDSTSYKIRYSCGFASDGTNVYFTGYADSGRDLFKIDADGVITLLSAVIDDSERSVYHEGKIYMSIYDDSETNLWVYDIDSGSMSQLSGTGSDPVAEDTVESDSVVSIGKWLFFIAEDSSGDDIVFMQDMTAEFSPVKINYSIAASNFLSPQDLVVHDGALYFEDRPDSGQIKSIYKYDLDTGITTTFFTPSDPNYQQVFYDYFISSDLGLFALMYTTVDNNQRKSLIEVTDSGGVAVTLPDGYDITYANAVLGGLIMTDEAGVGYIYDGSRFEPTEMSFAGRDWSIRDALQATHGTFVAFSEYPYDSFGPWDTELGYLGTLQPLAVKRFGVPVDEDPAQPYTSDPDVLEGRLDGSIDPVVVVPPMGTDGSGDGGSGTRAPIAKYEGPRIFDISSPVVPRGTTVVLTGPDMDLVSRARVGLSNLEIVEQTATSLTLFVSEDVALGSATLYLTAVNGTLYTVNAFTVIETDEASTPIVAVPQTGQKVNAGSFKGYVVIYALNYEGQRLSAKVCEDWVIVPSIPSSRNNLYRYVEKTVSVLQCNVRIFIDRELVRTVYLTTR